MKKVLISAVVLSILLSIGAILLVDQADKDDQSAALAIILSFSAVCDMVAGCLLLIHVPGPIWSQRMYIFIWVASLVSCFYFGLFRWSRDYLIPALVLKLVPVAAYGCAP